MRHPSRFWLSSLTLSAAIALMPSVVGAQTPEPAAGNPAINSTPAPGSTTESKQVPMASPSSEAQIPKGSNPEGGSGNMAAGSGATPSSQASEDQGSSSSTVPQTASKPEDSDNSASMGSNTNGSESPSDTIPTGKYASPPDLAPAPSQGQTEDQ